MARTHGLLHALARDKKPWSDSRGPDSAQSSTEAEYIALWEAGKEVSWLRNLHKELGLTQEKPTMLISDSTGAVSIAKNLLFHKRTKHIDSRFHWVREKVQAGRFVTEFCPSQEQTADMLTKPLPQPLHDKHTKSLWESLSYLTIG